MMSIKYNNLVEEMLKIFPELSKKYEKLKDSYQHINETPGVHVVFGDIFTKHIVCLTKNPDTKKSEYLKVFDFVESMLWSKDFEVRCVAEVSILEDLIDNNTINLVSHYIKSKTSQKISEIKKKWGVD